MEGKIMIPIYEAHKEAASTAYTYATGWLMGTLRYSKNKTEMDYAARLLSYTRQQYDTEMAGLRKRYDVDDLASGQKKAACKRQKKNI